MEFRLAKLDDAGQLLSIYKPYVEKTAITFEYEVPTIEEFQERIEKNSKIFPYIVGIEDGKIIAYAYAGRYRERKAYDWVVELSIYVDENERHHGVGKQLYRKLLELLKRLNYQRAYACITYPNYASISFHQSLGFTMLGIFEKSGYKFEQWHGIAWMDIALQESDVVEEVKGITELTKEEITEVLY